MAWISRLANEGYGMSEGVQQCYMGCVSKTMPLDASTLDVDHQMSLLVKFTLLRSC